MVEKHFSEHKYKSVLYASYVKLSLSDLPFGTNKSFFTCAFYTSRQFQRDM